MSTSTPFLASVPYSTLPRLSYAASTEVSRNIDDLLDELDSESDSGYDEVKTEDDKDSKGRVKQAIPQTERQTSSDQPSRWFTPLVDGPAMCPSYQADQDDTETLSKPSATAPAWTKWTSSRVICTDTALATNEDKLECVWLLAGCEDGTVWIFCSVFATTNTAGDTGTTTPRSRAQSELQQNRLRTSTDRPSFTRQKSEVTPPRKGAAPPSSSSAVSRTGTASGFAPSRVASATHSKRHRSGHGGSISLAVHGAASSSSHSGAHTPVGRKASATISITDLDALSNEVEKVIEAPERTKSPPFRTSIANMSFEELVPYESIDHRQINFEPIAHVYPRASHSPIVSVKLLPQENYTSSFVCLTSNGQLFKFAVRDGMVINHLDLGKALFPRTTHLSLADCRLIYSPDPSRVIVKSNQAGLLVPIDVQGLKFETESFSAFVHQGGRVHRLAVRSTGQVTVSPFSHFENVQHEDSHAAGAIAMPDGSVITGIRVVSEDIVVYSDSFVQILVIVDRKLSVLRTIHMKGKLLDILVLSARRLALVFESLVRFMPVDEDTDSCLLLDFALSETIEAVAALKQPTSTDDMLVLITADADKSRAISVAPVQVQSNDDEPAMRIAYQTKPLENGPIEAIPVASRQIDDATVVIGYSNGQVRFDTVDYQDHEAVLQTEGCNSFALMGAITYLQVYSTPKMVYAIAGSLEGHLGVWDAYAQVVLASFQVFSDPVLTVCETEGKYLAVSAEGAIAILDKQGLLDQPLLLSSSRYPIERLYIRQAQLMAFYEQGRARLWDLDSGKLQKSLTHVEAFDVISHMEGWVDLELPKRKCAPALSTNFRDLVEEATSAAITSDQNGEMIVHPAVKWLLSRHLVTPEEEYVRHALEGLGVKAIEPPTVALTSPLSASIFVNTQPRGPLMITQRVSAERLLVTVALLRVFLNFTDTERYANEAIAYYATTISEEGLPGQKDVSLDYLADFWLDSSNEIRQAARLLFGSRVGRLADDEVLTEVQDRQARMLRTSAFAAKDLLVLGELAIAQHKLLATGTLRDIANQIVRALETGVDLNCTCVALELCAKGFATFQNKFDAVRALRAVFKLAVNPLPTLPTETIPQGMATSVRNLARQAVLAAASVNAPLFMTVLSIDAIQSDADPEERATTLKLIAFMVRKKPVVLFAQLPRLVDAVVKSLDPRGTLRGTLQQTATFILSELVKIYPSVAFHGKTQRLAVGTHEGACIVYDLKTATRLYILHSHNKRASAVSYSPDGRRLVTMSLEESNVKVWKVGTSLLGLLTPAGPPPQGHGSHSNEAYKTLEFKLASPEEAMMTAAAQLEWLNVEWLEERRVKISIRETALTFSVA